MYRITLSSEGLEVDTYGDDLTIQSLNGTVIIALPNWLTDLNNQVLVKGANSFNFSGNALTVNPRFSNPFTLTLRG